MLKIFFDRSEVDRIAFHKSDLKDSLWAFAKAFFPIAFVFDIQISVFVFLYSILTNVGFFQSVLLSLLVIFSYFILAPLLFIFQVVFAYFWGSVTFFLADFMRHKSGKLQDFNSAVIYLFACVKFVQCLMFLVPLVGWISAIFFQFYSVSLYYRLVKLKFGLTPERATILVMLPLDILLSFILVVSIILFVFVVGYIVL
jgi:hypothetical protein